VACFLFVLIFILAGGGPAFWGQPTAVQFEMAGTVMMLAGLLTGLKRQGWGAALITAGWLVFFVVEFIIKHGRPPWVFTAFLIVAALYAYGWRQKRRK
jgi:peptidoglycan/LPS O-acetylase OafA/YrhL